MFEFLMDAKISTILATSNKTTNIARFLEDSDKFTILNPLVACWSYNMQWQLTWNYTPFFYFPSSPGNNDMIVHLK